MATNKIPSQAVVFADILDGYIKDAQMPQKYIDVLKKIDANKTLSKRFLESFKRKLELPRDII